MKTISVEELHEQTERVINEATQDTLVVTRNGRPQAILRPYPDEAALRRHWEEREQALAQVTKVIVDSTDYVSEDRGGR
jgi:PHD/YefM family antitoxin component YafN of YafNO toxin-antitoxin module